MKRGIYYTYSLATEDSVAHGYTAESGAYHRGWYWPGLRDVGSEHATDYFEPEDEDNPPLVSVVRAVAESISGSWFSFEGVTRWGYRTEDHPGHETYDGEDVLSEEICVHHDDSWHPWEWDAVIATVKAREASKDRHPQTRISDADLKRLHLLDVLELARHVARPMGLPLDPRTTEWGVTLDYLISADAETYSCLAGVEWPHGT